MDRVLIVILTAFVASCTSVPASDEPVPTVDEELLGNPGCFYRRQVSDFRPLDRQRMVVYAPTKSNAYLVRISPPSSSLRWADSIAFQSRSSRICGYAGDRLLIDRSSPAQQYSIASDTKLDAGAHDELLAQFGLGPKGEGLEPEDNTGAEIERDIDAAETDEK